MKRYVTMVCTWIILTITFSWISKALDFPKDREFIGVFIVISIITGIFTIIASGMTSCDK